MKGWIITALVLVGGYSVFQWVMHQRRTPAGARTSAGAGVQLGPLGVSFGIQSNVDPIASGVPVFNDTPVANGHGDQVYAAMHTNPDATMSGGPMYEPAFGPNTNQVSDNEMPLGL